MICIFQFRAGSRDYFYGTLGGSALVLGVALHTFQVVNALVAERWGARHTGKSLGWINMIGQFPLSHFSIDQRLHWNGPFI